MVISRLMKARAEAQGQERFEDESREAFVRRVMLMWNARKKTKYIKEHTE